MANKFKLATESALMLTLIGTILLKIDLSQEAITANHVGVVLLGVNIFIPAFNLAIGLFKPYLRRLHGAALAEGPDPDDLFTSEYVASDVEVEDMSGFKFDNPIVHVDPDTVKEELTQDELDTTLDYVAQDKENSLFPEME